MSRVLSAVLSDAKLKTEKARPIIEPLPENFSDSLRFSVTPVGTGNEPVFQPGFSPAFQ